MRRDGLDAGRFRALRMTAMLRFKIRTLMIAVVAIGLLVAALIEVRRLNALSRLYSKRASEERQIELMLKYEKLSLRNAKRESAWFEEVIEYHSRLKTKYRDASDRPWQRVEPDPPEPIAMEYAD